MKTTISILTILICSYLLHPVQSMGQKNKALSINDNREIFVDQFLIEELNNVELVMHSPRDEGPVFYFDKPWEGGFSGYCTIIKDGGLYRAYYRGHPVANKDGSNTEVTCYAESQDGKNWVKPSLRIYEIKGSMDNNVILAEQAPSSHNFSPFLDTNPKTKPQERYKSLTGTTKSGLMAYVSADGVHWEKVQDRPVYTNGVFDSQNVTFWSKSEQQYVCYFRTWSDGGFTQYKGFRTVSRTTSKDFINWDDPVHMEFGDTPLEHLYTQQTSPYYRAPHIYVAIGARFMPNRQVVSDDQAVKLNVNPRYYKDCSDAILMTSRGGNQYDRTFMESFIRPGIGLKNWVSRSNYPALNVVQTGLEEMSVYVNEDYAQPTAHLNRYSMRIDGFSSLQAPYAGGVVLTRVFTFEGTSMEINYSTSAAGEIKIEIQDEKGKPISGYELDNCQTIIGNEISRTVTWNGSEDVSNLASKKMRMKIVMKDANLYALKFNK